NRDDDQEDDGKGVLPAPDQSGIEHIVVVMMETARSITSSAGFPAPMDGRQASCTGTATTSRFGPIRWRPTIRGAGIPIPITRTRAVASSMTTAAATDSSAPGTTTSTP